MSYQFVGSDLDMNEGTPSRHAGDIAAQFVSLVNNQLETDPYPTVDWFSIDRIEACTNNSFFVIDHDGRRFRVEVRQV